MKALLQVENLYAGYGQSEVVRDLSFTVGEGEVVALLGPNGAGKTTTLMTVSGLLPALRGRIRLFGSRIDARTPHRNAQRGLAHVTEGRSLFGGLTVRENLHLAARSRRLTEVGEYFPPLEALMDRRAGLLSGGEQQMLAIARAIVSRPKLLMIDEMSLGLAPVVLERLAVTVRRIVERTGIGILMVEQHVPVALSVADRAILLRHGRAVAEGTATSLALRPDVLHAGYLAQTGH
jgi:branched-chain amino acid transport system ATP-binding protein